MLKLTNSCDTIFHSEGSQNNMRILEKKKTSDMKTVSDEKHFKCGVFWIYSPKSVLFQDWL